MQRAEAHLHIAKARKGDESCISLRKLPNYQVEYAGYVLLEDAKFAVQPAGLKRFRDQGQKNVHAFVRGTLVDYLGNQPGGIKAAIRPMREAYYNPLTCDSFIDKESKKPLTTARIVVLLGTKVYYTE